MHLITLAFLGSHPAKRPWLRIIRMSLMLILFVLLLVAIWPQTRSLYAYSTNLQTMRPKPLDQKGRIKYYIPWLPTRGRQGLPVRCFWNQELKGAVSTDARGPAPLGIESDAIISYLILCSGYCWRLCQLVPSTRRFSKLWLYAKPSYALEQQLRLQQPGLRGRIVERTYMYIYVLIVVVNECLRTFIASLLYLLGTIAWGTMQLISIRSQAPQEAREDESKLSFGQLLPMLMLIQPFTLIFEYSMNRGM